MFSWLRNKFETNNNKDSSSNVQKTEFVRVFDNRRSISVVDDQFIETDDQIIRKITFNNFQIELDLSAQTLQLDVLEDHFREIEISSTLPEFGRKFVSASLLAFKAKQFDDRLYAAVELAAQNGAGKFPGKKLLLAELTRKLSATVANESGDIYEILYAAAELGGINPKLPANLKSAVKSRVSDFLKNELRSKPISFYTSSEQLKSIFRQDRMLQSEIKNPGGIETIADYLRQNSRMLEIYENYLNLTSKLTNPLVSNGLMNLIDNQPTNVCEVSAKTAEFNVSSGNLSFFPPSQAHETDLVKRLYGYKPIPHDFNLVDEMIKRIRSDEINLAPTDHSGWYDYQTWALEPFVMPELTPEAARLRITGAYSNHLLEIFKSVLAQTRETHIKQLEIPEVGCIAEIPSFSQEVEVNILPKLTVEPIATYYLRRARSYQFICEILLEFFGEDGLKEMHGLTANKAKNSSLDEELNQMIAIFHGAYQTVNQQLGLFSDAPFEIESDSVANSLAFENWAQNLENDEDLKQDPRMMVPLFYDLGRGQTKVWVVLGWAYNDASVSFLKEPTIKMQSLTSEEIDENVQLNLTGDSYQLIYPVSAEIYVDKILDRNEFREHCDKYKTQTAILENLK